jgi:hypothetical protein
VNICRTLFIRQLSARIAIWLIVIHALLPALAVAAALSDDSFSAPTFCGDKSGAPGKHHVPMLCPHCGLCCGFAHSLVPSQNGFLRSPVLADITVGHRWLSSGLARRSELRSAALPRGPPTAA